MLRIGEARTCQQQFLGNVLSVLEHTTFGDAEYSEAPHVLSERLKTVQQHGLGRICLDREHSAKFCKKGFTCRISGCGKDHHYLIHPESDDENSSRVSSNNVPESVAISNSAQTPDAQVRNTVSSGAKEPSPVTSHAVCSSTSAIFSDPVAVGAVKASRPRVCFKVLSVKIGCKGGTGQIITYAFLDSGSDATFCLGSLVQELGLTDMKPTSFPMTTANCEEHRGGHEVQLNIESLEGDAKFQLDNVLTMDNLHITPRHMATNEDLKRWPHLRDISLP